MSRAKAIAAQLLRPGLFGLSVALWHRSFWYGALAVYYLLLRIAAELKKKE